MKTEKIEDGRQEIGTENPNFKFQISKGTAGGKERGRERERGGFEEPLTPTLSPSDGEREGAEDGRALLDELEGVLKRFVVLPKYAAETLALWTLHTYALGVVG